MAKVSFTPAILSTRNSPPTARISRLVFGRVIREKALAVFVRQLATLVRAGLPLVRALEVLARQEKNAPFAAVLRELIETIRSGGTFSDGLRRHSRVFDRLFVNLVKAGEAAGALVPVLERLALFTEKSVHIKGRVKSAMTYPVIILLVAVTIVAGLIVFVIPRFQGIFAGLLKGQPLPALTRGVLAVSDLIRSHLAGTLVITIVWVGVMALIRRSQRGTRWIDWWLIRLPVVGDLFLKVGVARFARTLGTLLASGVPILSALLITRDTAGNVHVAAAIDQVHDRVKTGDGVAGPLAATRIFPDMVASMIEVGEETGALPEMLTRVAETYDEEVDNAVASLTTLIEPLMIVVMAVVVGIVVIALFLPIIRIIQALS